MDSSKSNLSVTYTFINSHLTLNFKSQHRLGQLSLIISLPPAIKILYAYVCIDIL